MTARLDLSIPSLKQPQTEQDYLDEVEKAIKADYKSMLGTTGSPVRINPWSFIGTLGTKKQALAVAREIDVQRGVQPDSTTRSEVKEADNATDSSHSTARRLPSGARPPSNGQNLEAATSEKHDFAAGQNSNDESIRNVAGQSTPLAQTRMAGGSKNGKDTQRDLDLQKEELMKEDARRETLEDILELRDEIEKLKAINETQRQDQEKMNDEVVQIKKALRDKTKEITSLEEIVNTKESSIVAREEQLNELRRLAELKEQERIREIDSYKTRIKAIQSLMASNGKTVAIGKDGEHASKYHASIDTMLEKLKCQAIEKSLEINELLKREAQNSKKKVEELNAQFKLEKNQVQEQHKEQLNKLEQLLNANSESIKSMVCEINEKSKIVISNVEEINQMKRSASDLEAENLNLKKEFADSKDTINKLQNELREKGANFGKVKNEICSEKKDLENKLVKCENLIEVLKKRITEKETDLEKQIAENLQGTREKTKLNARLTESNTFANQLKKDIASAATTTEEAVRNYEKILKQYSEETKKHEVTSECLRNVTSLSADFQRFVRSLKLFNIELGLIIETSFNRKEHGDSFESFFCMEHENIVGFYYEKQQNKHNELQDNLQRITEENRSLLNDIDTKWKSAVEEQKRRTQLLIKDLANAKSNKEHLEYRVSELEKTLTDNQRNKELMMNEKEKILTVNASLLDEVEGIRKSAMEESEQKLNDLLNRVEEFAKNISEIQEQIINENEQQKVLKDTVSVKDAKIQELEDKYYRVDEALREKSIEFQKLQGDISKRINFEIAHKSRPDIEKTNYAALMIDKVDYIDMVELQNIVKNLILLLEIPFNKLTKKSPLVAIYLKYERPIFSHFANRLHYEIFNEPIDMKGFTSDAYDQYTENHSMTTIQHPLESCLDNLYQKIVSRM